MSPSSHFRYTLRSAVRFFVMVEYSATVGASDGNIIAAIITSQMPRNQASDPSAVPGRQRKPAAVPPPMQSRGQAAHENCAELMADFP